MLFQGFSGTEPEPEPEPSEPFFPKPKAEPEPPEPFSRNRNRNRNRPFLLNCTETQKNPFLESSIRGGLRGGGSIFLCIDLGESFPFAAVQQAILKSMGNRDRPFGISLMNVCVCPECTFRWSDSLVCLPKGCLLFSGALSLFFAWTNGQVL